MTMSIRATPFHARAADANRGNLWAQRGRFTLASEYAGVAQEAAAARFAVAMADISWRWRVRLEGARLRELTQRLFTKDPNALEPGQALKALWLADQGGVRGAGVVARLARQSFELTAACEDAAWIGAAASLFAVTLTDRTEEEGGLALIGPYAETLVATLGLDATLAPLAFRAVSWKGLDVTLTRFGEHGGYEIWCKPDDAPLVWDRVAAAGEPFALQPAGLDAMDLLDLEAGVPRPGRDYDGATAPDAAEPLAGALRLASLIDGDHPFNGAVQAHAHLPRRKLTGLLIDSDTPAPFAPVFLAGKAVGRTLSSRYSPFLRRAIALVQLDEAHAAPGTALSLTLPSSRNALPKQAAARVTDLPFIPPPASIPA
jgi:aminomethyltransferase